jgi:hypothetical protein
MFSNIPEALGKLKDNFVDEVTKKIAEEIRDRTNGTVNIESILNGQVKVDGNAYIDKMLSTVSEKIEESQLQEIKVPNHSMAFEKDVMCGLVFPGQVDFQNGLITGLSSLCRMEDSNLRINAFEDPIITARAVVGIKEALVNYLANVKFLCLNQDETQLSGGLKDINLIISLKVSRDFSVNLDQFEVKSTGSLNLNGFETLGIFDFLKDTMSADLEMTIKEAVKKYLQETIKSLTEEVMSKLPLKL